MSLSFFVPGTPAPQGSKRHVGKGVMVESSKAVAPWRESIREAARKASGVDRVDYPEGPLSVRLLFVMPRPAGAPKRRTPPAVKRPDVDKLVRAVFDALTSAGTWKDDSQVVELYTSKRLAEIGELAGVLIFVQSAITEEAA